MIEQNATVAVIGAGQAGLSAAYHLQNAGFKNAEPGVSINADTRTFIVFDENPAPGGAWQHRWQSLTMATVNNIFDLPGLDKPHLAKTAPSSEAVPGYFADFEEKMRLPIFRPVTVQNVTRRESGESYLLETTAGNWVVEAIINATGTWNNPLKPEYEGSETFKGEQLHTRDYVAAEDFTGKRVAVVGAGISAVQQLEEISRHTKTFWYTRNEPDFRDGSFRPEVEGRDVIARVTADAEAGEPAKSVVSYTGLPWLPYVQAAKDRGALERRPMFTRIEPGGVREADGSYTTVDVILWATGFRADLKHLDPLELQNERGGIAVHGTAVAEEPRLHLIGYGPSQSTVGANRAGRQAVRELTKTLRR